MAHESRFPNLHLPDRLLQLGRCSSPYRLGRHSSAKPISERDRGLKEGRQSGAFCLLFWLRRTEIAKPPNPSPSKAQVLGSGTTWIPKSVTKPLEFITSALDALT